MNRNWSSPFKGPFKNLSRKAKKKRSEDDENNIDNEAGDAVQALHILPEIVDNNPRIGQKESDDVKKPRHIPNKEISRKSSDNNVAIGDKKVKKKRKKKKERDNNSGDNNAQKNLTTTTAAAAASANDSNNNDTDLTSKIGDGMGNNDMDDSEFHHSSPKREEKAKKKSNKKKKRTSKVQEESIGSIEAFSPEKKIKKKKKVQEESIASIEVLSPEKTIKKKKTSKVQEESIGSIEALSPEKTIRKKKNKRKKAPEEEKDNKIDEGMEEKEEEDEKDRMIQNLREELEKKDVMIGSLHETLESLREKVQSMERKLHNSLNHIESLEGNVENTRDKKSSSNNVDREDVEECVSEDSLNLFEKNSDTGMHAEQSSVSESETSEYLEEENDEKDCTRNNESSSNKVDREEVEESFSEKSESLFEKNSDTDVHAEQSSVSESETSEYLDQENDDEGSINLQDVFDLPLSEHSSSKESLSQTETARSHSRRPLLEAALKAKSKSESHLKYDCDNASLNEEDIFDPPTSRSRSRRPLLEAALKAKTKSESYLKYIHSNSEMSDSWENDESREEKSNVVPEHLLSLSQPRLYHPSDIHSIDDDDLFESLPEDPPPGRPLLRAALQAKAQQEEGLLPPSNDDVPNQLVNGHHAEKVPEHLVMVNQPAIVHVHDEYSIESEVIFEAFTEQDTCTSRPLLTAALKAKAQQEQRLTKSFSYFETKFVDTKVPMTYEELSKSVPDHLSNLHQPIKLSSHAHDEYSIESEEIFDASTEQPTCTSKPLLAAALKANAEQEQRLIKSFSHCEAKSVHTELSTVNKENDLSKSVPDHLTLLHQPINLSSHVHDALSIDDDTLFDPPQPAVKKPLLAAALLAKKTNEEFPAMKNRIKFAEGTEEYPDHESDDREAALRGESSVKRHNKDGITVMNKNMNIETATKGEMSVEDEGDLRKENACRVCDEEKKNSSIDDSDDGTIDEEGEGSEYSYNDSYVHTSGEEEARGHENDDSYDDDDSYEHTSEEEGERCHEDVNSYEVTPEGENVFGVEDYENDKEEDDEENKLDELEKKLDELEEVHRRLLAESNEGKIGHRKMNLAKENNEEEESSADEDNDSDSDEDSDSDSDDDSGEGGDGVEYEKTESYGSDNDDEAYGDSSYEGVGDDEDSDENDSEKDFYELNDFDDIRSPEDSL